MTSIYLSAGRQLRMTFEAIDVESGPAAHRLSLRFQATPDGLPDGTTALVTGSLRLSTGGWIGALQADAPLPIGSAPTYPRPVVLSTTITDAQLASIEDRRGGADLELRADLGVTLLTTTTTTQHSLSGSAQETLRIPAPTWAQHAERLGALVAVALLVPLPLGDPNSQRAKAGARLHAALRAVGDDRPEEAVRQARMALELHQQDTPSVGRPGSVRPRERDLPTRFAVLEEALYSVASGAHHEDEITAKFVYNRADAVAIVGCVAALLQRHG